MFKFYEFFAGAGMARAGFGSEKWRCLFANDFDVKKGDTYNQNWVPSALKTVDVRSIKVADLPGVADLVWASFPCQDLSLAGGGAGLRGDRSGTFWPFWKLIKDLIADGRAPKIIALENVCGTLTSHAGKDFQALCESISNAGYNFGAMVIDAQIFLPQSRPRLFIIATHKSVRVPPEITNEAPNRIWHSRSLLRAQSKLSEKVRKDWLWWTLPEPPIRNQSFADILEEPPPDVQWWTQEQTERLISMMADTHLAKLDAAKNSGKTAVGTIYKRTRQDATGRKIQRAEVRFDDIAGCLRTPAGGSSRQLIMVVEGNRVRVRLISGRETARLMGLPEDYNLPKKYNETYHLTGDGVAVPVVRYLAENIFEKLLWSVIEHDRIVA